MGLDAELQANLNKAKSGRMMFAFAHKGSSGSLLVDRKISGKDAAEAKKKAGGGTLFRGRCFGEEGQMIFEIAKEPPAALEAAIRRTINLEAGLSLKVVVRFAVDAEAEVSDQEPQAAAQANGAVLEAPPSQAAPIPPAPALPSGDAAFKNRLKAVQAQLSAAGGPTPDQQMLLNQAFSAARDKDYAAALDTLKEIDGSKKVKKQEPATLESTTFQRSLADLKPRFDQARVINSDLMPQMGQVMSLAKANRYVDALEMLDNLAIEVDRTLAAAPKPADTGDKFKARLKALLPKYNTAVKQDPVLLTKLRPLMGQVIARSNANQFEQASVFLIQIEKALNVARPGDVADAVMHRFTGLKEAIKAALSAGGPNVARIQTLVGAIGGLLKNKDTVQADKTLDELEPLLKTAGGAGAADLSAKWKAKLAQWSPAIKKAMADKGPNAAAMAKLLAQATALSKPGGDMAQALAKLTECHALAGAEEMEAEDEKEEDTAQGEAKDSHRAEWERRITALEARVLDAQKTRAGEANWMAQFMSAQDLGSAGDFAKALEILNKLETRLDAQGTADGPNAAAIKAALAGWETARGDAIAQLQKLEDAIKGFDHSQSAEAIILLKAIQANLTAKPETLQGVDELERYLVSDDIITEAEEPNGFGITVDLREPLLDALGKLKPLLSA